MRAKAGSLAASMPHMQFSAMFFLISCFSFIEREALESTFPHIPFRAPIRNPPEPQHASIICEQSETFLPTCRSERPTAISTMLLGVKYCPSDLPLKVAFRNVSNMRPLRSSSMRWRSTSSNRLTSSLIVPADNRIFSLGSKMRFFFF